MNPYYMKIVYRTNLGVIAYLALAWIVGRLSWPLVGAVFIYWLLLPFALVWARPQHSARPFWGRIIATSALIAIAALAAALTMDFFAG